MGNHADIHFVDPIAPGTGAQFTQAAHEGHLLVLQVLSHRSGIQTAYGLTEAIAASVFDLETHEEFEDALLFGNSLVGTLRGLAGQWVLGRLGRGLPKPGQSPPWVLLTASDADKTKAETWKNLRFGDGETPGSQPVGAPQIERQEVPAGRPRTGPAAVGPTVAEPPF